MVFFKEVLLKWNLSLESCIDNTENVVQNITKFSVRDGAIMHQCDVSVISSTVKISLLGCRLDFQPFWESGCDWCDHTFVDTLHCAPYRAPRFCQEFAILMVNKDNGGPACNQKTWTVNAWKWNNNHYRSNCRFKIRSPAVLPLFREKSTLIWYFKQ